MRKRFFSCPKCGYDEVSVLYRAAEEIYQSMLKMISEKLEERFICICQRCEFQWVEPLSTLEEDLKI